MFSGKTVLLTLSSLLFLSVGMPEEVVSLDDQKDKDNEKMIRESGIDPIQVEEAISKGIRWLKKETPGEAGTEIHLSRDHELILYTLLHAGVSPDDETFQNLLKQILERKLESTYSTSLQAMVLQELDAKKYQWRIAQCGQFLVDNQCKSGQWGYGKETELTVHTPTETPKDVATRSDAKVGKEAKKPSKRPENVIHIKPQRQGPATGDNSNSQYAALGIRACMEANVLVPGNTLSRALQWWEKSQRSDGGWGYGNTDSPWGSMTAGAVASVIIYRHYLRQNFKTAPSVNKGIFWMAKNFTVTDNPKRKSHWHFYYLYALERVGMLAGLDRIGANRWYAKGATYLLNDQKEDGSWEHKKKDKKYSGPPKWDTCFAILFLKMATAPVETGVRK